MEIDFDLFRGAEHFSTLENDCCYEDIYPGETTTMNSSHVPNVNDWDMETDQIINGDISLIPITNETSSKFEEIQIIVNDLHQLFGSEQTSELAIDETLTVKDEEVDVIDQKDDTLNSVTDFDIVVYMNDEDPSSATSITTNHIPTTTILSSTKSTTTSASTKTVLPSTSNNTLSLPNKKLKAGVKKIDVKAQRYIIDEEDDVDIETVSECDENSPVIEARDVASLLEQFEAAQLPTLSTQFDTKPIVFEGDHDRIFIENSSVIPNEIFDKSPGMIPDEIFDKGPEMDCDEMFVKSPAVVPDEIFERSPGMVPDEIFDKPSGKVPDVIFEQDSVQLLEEQIVIDSSQRLEQEVGINPSQMLEQHLVIDSSQMLEQDLGINPSYIFEDLGVNPSIFEDEEIVYHQDDLYEKPKQEQYSTKEMKVEDDKKYSIDVTKQESKKTGRKKSKEAISKEKNDCKEQDCPVNIKDKKSLAPTKRSEKDSTTKNVPVGKAKPQAVAESKNVSKVPSKATKTTLRKSNSKVQKPIQTVSKPVITIPKHVTKIIKESPEVILDMVKQSSVTMPKIVKKTVTVRKIVKKSPETVSKTIPKRQEVVEKCPTLTKTAESTTSIPPNKLIRDSLPPELIARIKESGKRKPIPVIPAIAPSRKRPRPTDPEPEAPSSKHIKLTILDTVKLDHDYCIKGPTQLYPKNPKKDSGFESDEDDEREVISKQPTVKNADGKLMVSLLKVNTIHTFTQSNQKKKLNLEEYKKRRKCAFTQPQNVSPDYSPCDSPMTQEDEDTRMLKHQEKLKKMAKEVLKTLPKKCEAKPEVPLVIKVPQTVKVPEDMVLKTFVSIGTNTDFKTTHKNIKDPLAPVERLDEIKPLLKKASDKINGNSLITSVIENIPKVINSCDPEPVAPQPNNAIEYEHGEDKTLVFLPKNREMKETKSVECQTNISLIQQTKDHNHSRENYNSSSSSSSSDCISLSRRSAINYRRNRNSNSSRSSRSFSSYSSESYPSGGSSRSSSPRYSNREADRLREVEERRVIYVGRIAPGTTKDELKRRFHHFGKITNISLHSRNHSYLDSYGFVTFADKLDAYKAIEHGNDDPLQPKYDLSFGGRRIFCQNTYSDLDNMKEDSRYATNSAANTSFDALLRTAQETIRKRKA